MTIVVFVFSSQALLLGPASTIAQEPLVEFYANVVDENDARLTDSTNRSVKANVGEIASIELSYTDLRRLGGDTGLFSFAVDIQISNPDAIELLLIERQRIVIDSAIREVTDGFFDVSLEGSTDNIQIPFDVFLFDAELSLEVAVAELTGRPLEQVSARRISLFGQQDLEFDIRFRDLDSANKDLPNVQVVANFDIPVETTTLIEDVTNPDGSPNTLLLSDSLDFRSRNLMSDDPFGEVAYGSLQRADFDPQFGFQSIATVGPLDGSGIAGVFGVRPDDFDIVTIPFRIKSEEVVELNFSVSSGGETLLYGVNVLVNEQSSFAPSSTITIDTTVEPEPPQLPWWVRFFRWLYRILLRWLRMQFSFA